jgi:diadenosine tetraphosphate (Ap4A) HIT family hydrolase
MTAVTAVDLVFERRRALAFALHEPNAPAWQLRALRVEAEACHSSVLAFEAKLSALTNTAAQVLGQQLRVCADRLDRALVGLVADLPSQP